MLQDFLRNNQKLIYPCLILILLIAAIVVWTGVLVTRDTFYGGISIENVSVAGLTVEQAHESISRLTKETFDHKIISLRYKDKNWKIDINELSPKFTTQETLEHAYSLGRDGNILQRIYNIAALNLKTINLNQDIVLDQKKLASVLADIKEQIDIQEKDAEVEYRNGRITSVKEVIGRSLNIDNNVKLVQNQINNRNFNTIDLYVEDMVPEVTYSDTKDMTGIIAMAQTSFNTYDTNRTHNIRLACDKLNGIVLKPKEIFSMNTALGPRTLENGYKDAPVIFMNELIEGPGGGVCQVTTTLYNAVLKSKMGIVERTHHSMPLGYAEPGQDATIAEDYIDFKFRNSSLFPVSIGANVEGNQLKIYILGKPDSSGYTVKLRSEILEVYEPEGQEVIIDNTVPDFQRVILQEAKKGMRVVVYRETYDQNSQLVDREVISEDIYKPVKSKVKVNQNYYDKYEG